MSTRDEDAAWRQIVDNYGDQPDLSDLDASPADESSLPDPLAEPLIEPFDDRSLEAPPTEPFRFELYDDHFVPPPLPPAPAMRPERRIAWIGLLGSPTLLIVFTVFDFAIPPALTAALVIAFLGSFGYLVATMEPHDPDDDGARV